MSLLNTLDEDDFDEDNELYLQACENTQMKSHQLEILKISEERLNLKLKRSVQSLINREDHRIKKGANILKNNPGSLRARVQVLSAKFHELSSREDFTDFETIRNTDMYEQKLKFKMLYTHALVITTL